MQPSNSLVDFTKEYEGFSATPYKDSGGVWTVGYGHTSTAKKYIGSSISEQKGEDLLMIDLSFTSVSVNQLVTSTLNQNQFDAICDWTFNLGSGTLKKSTLLKCLNSSQFDLVPKELRKWVFVKENDVPTVEPGLVRRREAEVELFSRT